MAHYLKTPFLLALVFLANASAVFGQSIFQKRSDLNYSFDMFSNVYPSDTGFFVLGQGISSMFVDSVPNPGRRLTMTWYNWSGDTVRHKNFVINNSSLYSMWYDSNTLFDGGFYHSGGIQDTINNMFVCKFNYDGDTLWSNRINGGFFDVGTTGIIANNGDFVAVGFSRLASGSSKRFTRIIRYDSLGNVRWNKIYNNVFGNQGYYILKDNDSNFYISGFAAINNASGSNPKNYRGMVLKIDSLGTQIWMKSIPGLCDDYSGGITFAADGNILMSKNNCFSQPSGAANYSTFSIYKLNKITGDTFWHKEYPIQYTSPNSPNFIEQLNNGDIITGGRGLKLFIENEDTLGKYTGVLIRTDSIGNMKWQRYYFYNAQDAENMSESYLTDGKEAPDGGFILVGRTTHNTDFDDGWIIKTDENGCIDLSCVNGIEELDDEDFRLSIYPNPAEEYVSIDLPILYNKGTLQVYTMQGQLVKTAAITTGGTETFSISDMPNGVYQLVVYSSTNKLLGREKLVVAR